MGIPGRIEPLVLQVDIEDMRGQSKNGVGAVALPANLEICGLVGQTEVAPADA